MPEDLARGSRAIFRVELVREGRVRPESLCGSGWDHVGRLRSASATLGRRVAGLREIRSAAQLCRLALIEVQPTLQSLLGPFKYLLPDLRSLAHRSLKVAEDASLTFGWIAPERRAEAPEHLCENRVLQFLRLRTALDAEDASGIPPRGGERT